MKQFNTYEEVKNCGQYTLSTRWVITKKNGNIKARLVVRVFEEELMMRRDSQTVGKGTMRIFLAIVSRNKSTASGAIYACSSVIFPHRMAFVRGRLMQ